MKPDARWERPIPVELQIRTILQHQWSILSHSEFYKQIADIPPGIMLRMRALSEILNYAEVESDQLRRSRIADECGAKVRDLLHDVIEGQMAEASPNVGALGLHLLEFDRKLRRVLVSDREREARALRDLVALCESDAMPTGNARVAEQLADIVRRVRIVATPCFHE